MHQHGQGPVHEAPTEDQITEAAAKLIAGFKDDEVVPCVMVPAAAKLLASLTISTGVSFSVAVGLLAGYYRQAEERLNELLGLIAAASSQGGPPPEAN